MAGDQLHGVTESLERGAQMAAGTAANIEGHRCSLRPAVEALKGQWEGTARPQFDAAHAQWEQGITRLNAALNGLGESTRFSANTYATADQTGASSLGAAQGGSPFGGALRA